MLVTDQIIGHKALVDFFFEKPGKYQVTFKKGEQEKIFYYNKTNPPPLVVADLDYRIVIDQ